MAEGAGAAGLAAMLTEPERFRGRKVGLVLCGGNIDARLLASVMVRELERDDRIASFRITSNDRPGLLGHRGEPARRARRQHPGGVSHGRLFLDVPAKGVSIDVTIETRGQTTYIEIFEALAADGSCPAADRPARLVGDGLLIARSREPMATGPTVPVIDARSYRAGPRLTEGVIGRRFWAYLIDLVVIFIWICLICVADLHPRRPDLRPRLGRSLPCCR